ncbi:MAG: TetR/AcrR family transcriptional regulator [Spirochaetales bacterium]|nr:TetR/AcrR family transcriptional regulator [Spirochaetales bacterium]
MNNDKRVIKGKETSSTIIESAIDIISESGIDGVSAGNIARRAGISKSSIFHHFSSVDDIRLKVLNTITERMLGIMQNEAISSIDEFLDIIEAMLFNNDQEYQKTSRVFFAFYHASLFSKSYAEVFNNFLNQTIKELEAILKNLDIKPSYTIDTARLIIATLDGLSIQINITKDTKTYYASWISIKHIAKKYLKETQK